MTIVGLVHFVLQFLFIRDLGGFLEPGNNFRHLLLAKAGKRARHLIEQTFLGAPVKLVIIEDAEHGPGAAHDMVGITAYILLLVALPA